MSKNARQQILVVDDQEEIRYLMGEILNSPRRQVVAFEDPVAALTYAGKHPLSVAILDYIMPKMTGLELASRLKAIQPKCFIALCTGHQAEHHKTLAEAEEVDHLLRKPFEVRDLIRVCDHAVKA